jgi:hypothetical protein
MEFKKKNSPILLIGLILWVLITSLACVVTGNTPDESNNLAATQEALLQTQIALSVQQTIQAQVVSSPVPSAEAGANNPTAAPQGESQTDVCSGKTSVNYENVSFCYDPSIASGLASESTAEELSEMDESFNLPKHTKFTFQNYAISPTFHTPLLQVFPVAAYTQINSTIPQSVTDLQSVIQSQNTTLEKMPFLPGWNAAQFTVMQIKYLDFQNGKGVRYLTQYGQAYWPINSEDMFYTFQGITNDGKYYISAILPVGNPILPANGDAYQGDINALGDNFDAYLVDIKTKIDAQPAESFNPQLNQLDAMMQSFLVVPQE